MEQVRQGDAREGKSDDERPDNDPPGDANQQGEGWRRYLLRDELGVVIVLVGLVAVVGVVHPTFLSANNLLDTAQSSCYVGLMACGMVFPLAMREVDLSVGGNYALGIVLGAELMVHGLNPWLAALRWSGSARSSAVSTGP